MDEEKFQQNPASKKERSNNTRNIANNDIVAISVPIVEAHVIPENSPNHDITPVEYFQYNEEVLQHNDDNIPTAPAFSVVNNDFNESSIADVSRIASEKVRFGTEMGRIHAMEEKELIKKVSIDAKAMTYFANKRVEAAGEIAKKQAEELGRNGNSSRDYIKNNVDMKQALSAPKAKTSDSTHQNGHGYEVSEYNVEEYECSTYETTDYKSIYDD